MEKYNPITLASKNVALLSGEITVEDLMLTVVITIGVLIGSLLLSVALFHRKKL
jgi:hypothetical protein